MNPRDILREPEGAETAVLLLHGILSAPQYFTFLLDQIPPEYAVYGILLDGHGDTPDGLAKTDMRIWKRQVSDCMQVLTKRYDRILIAAHSMGTLFAVQLGAAYPEKIHAMLLLNIPMRIHLTPFGAVCSLLTACGLILKRHARAAAMKQAYSISPDARLWRYLRWIPRYLELFREIRRTRPLLQKLRMPCDVFQSARDELVSLRSLRILAAHPNLRLRVLRHSSHFYYPDKERARILRVWQKMLNFCKQTAAPGQDVGGTAPLHIHQKKECFT